MVAADLRAAISSSYNWSRRVHWRQLKSIRSIFIADPTRVPRVATTQLSVSNSIKIRILSTGRSLVIRKNAKGHDGVLADMAKQ